MSMSTDGQETRRLRFKSSALSDRGLRRDLNEDRFFLDDAAGVWAVADGMGGHDAGELASGAIVHHLRDLGVPASGTELRARVEERVVLANADIQKISQERGGAIVGTTLAALLTFGQQFGCLWAGDSRVYLVRKGQLTQVSRDHTELQDLLDKGLIHPDEASSYARRNVITNAIGVGEAIMLDLVQGVIESGDVFIICSDGLTAHVTDSEIAPLVQDLAPADACAELVRVTLERGATDNVTVVVVECTEEDEK